MIIYLCLILMTFIGSIASLFLKKASGSDGVKHLLLNPSLYIGGMLYFFSAVLNIWLLRFLDYSIVLPLTSLTYAWTMIISYLILKEKITRRKIAGVLLVIFGAIIVSV